MSEDVAKKNEIKIDVSSISNLGTMDQNPSMQDFVSTNRDKIIDKEKTVKETIDKGYELEIFEKYPRKFDFVQAEKIELPSHGVCYKNCDDEDVKNGFIWLYPMTMKEEEILSTSKYIYEGTATIIALNNCIKSNISAMDLLVSDFYYLLMYLRKISISDEWTFEIACPYCNHKFNNTIKISEQKFEEIDDKQYKEPIRVDLPKTNYTVLLGLPRIKSIREMSYIINKSNSELGVADFLYTRTIAIITNNGEELDKKDWIIFYNNLPHSDSDILVKMSEFDNGLQHLTDNVVCPSCGKTIEGSSVDLNTDALFRF